MHRWFSHFFKPASHPLPIRVVLTVPFVLQVVTSTFLVGYLAYRNGQQAVSNLVEQLMSQASDRIEQHLDGYLATPHRINQINLNAIATGLLDLEDFDRAGQFFRKTLDVYDVSYVSYGLANGDFIGAGYLDAGGELVIDEMSARTQGQNYSYATDAEGNRMEVIDVSEYDFFSEDWYSSTVEQTQPTWSEVYAWEEAPELLWIAANAPIQNAAGEILGVISVDFLLSEISNFIRNIRLSPNSRIFIIERDGLLIASSDQQSPILESYEESGEIERRSALESEDALVRNTMAYLTTQFPRFAAVQTSQHLTFVHEGKTQFALIEPWRDQYGLDWLVIAVVPEQDFMAQIHQSNRNTILLCIATVLIATQIGVWTSRWLTTPILKLNQAAKEIASGKLDQVVHLKRQDELGELAAAFNHMAHQLDTSFQELRTLNAALTDSEQQLQYYSQTLEEQVEARTQELSNTLAQLQTTQADLVQSEKLAALGQLIAGIAHEVNTPLGAIQASIGNIDHALKQCLLQLPPLFQSLPPNCLEDFARLLTVANQPKPLLSSREERQLRRQLTQILTEAGVEQAPKLAETLSKMGVSENLELLLPLLKRSDSLTILNAAYALSSVQTNSHNIQIAVERASKIVFALKNYIRQDQVGEKVKASIPDGIDTVLTLYHNQLKQGIEVTKAYTPVPEILCYPEELIQVWSNLITNAVQAMNYKGNLAIAVFQQDQQIVVQISDSGAGISPDILDKIFSPFFTTKPMGEGSGLGLHIVRQIIEKHTGTIEISSRPGHTNFTIKIPII
jgi:C4-dicarboxylate-specific signal transduction histidine kinase